MPAPSWLADEMLGRLARYLRILGCDTEYVRGASDDELLVRLRGSERVLLTRDRALAARTPRATLLHAPLLPGQLRELWAAYPELPRRPSFDRCTRCNGRLREDPSAHLRPARPTSGPSFRCEQCAHLYWRGSHTQHLERDLASWSAEAGR